MFFHEAWYIRALYSLPVFIVAALTVVLYYSFYAGYLVLVELSASLMLVLIFLHFCLFCYVWAYIRTVCTDPGTVPSNFDLISTELLLTDQESYNELDWAQCKSTFCKKCKRARPARAHHCSGCDRCILRMDHHCPWVGNCVGFHNLKYFVQFLVYSLVSCIIMACLSGGVLLEHYQGGEYEVWTLISTLGCLCLAAALGGLAGVNVWMIVCNKTTLELQKQAYNVFDLSTEDNWAQVCGSRLIYWIFPIKSYDAGDGVFYSVKMRVKSGETVIINDRVIASQ
jgi:palmitoyltransferase